MTQQGGADSLDRGAVDESDDDTAWVAQLGPALTEKGTAALLGLPADEVRHAPGLLRLRNRDGREVYPAVQFSEGRQITGVADVVLELSPALLPLTVASWLTGPQRALGGGRPVDLLREGHIRPVLRAAQQLVSSAAT